MSRGTRKVKTKLNCPYCDEESMPRTDKYILYTGQQTYIPRICIMGHHFWSVEYVPEDQEAITEEVKEIRNAWRQKDTIQK